MIKKYSVNIAGHATSISLEEEFFAELKKLATLEKTTLHALLAKIDAASFEKNLSSAVRVYILLAKNCEIERNFSAGKFG